MTTTTKEVTTKFSTLYIDPLAMKKITYYTEAAEGEVSGLGTIIKDEKGRYIVNQVFLLEQESSAADTDLNTESISKLMVDMMQRNEDPAQLKFWWHSHATMGVFWSGTDDTCAETLSHEFAFSLVVNKRGESKCRLDLYRPFRITFDGIKVTELASEDKMLQEECKKEVELKVKTPGMKNWEKWNQKDGHKGREWGGYGGYADYYGEGEYHGYGGYKHVPLLGSDKEKDKEKKITLSDIVVGDIDRLLDCSEKNIADGGIFNVDTWNEYVLETLKGVVEGRMEKKAACTTALTYDKEYADCTGKCKIKKACAYWTKFFEETEQDATAELADLNVESEEETTKTTIIV